MNNNTILLLITLIAICHPDTKAQTEDTLKLNWKSYKEPSGVLKYARFSPYGNLLASTNDGTTNSSSEFFLDFNFSRTKIDELKIATFDPNLSVYHKNDNGDNFTRFSASPRIYYSDYFKKRRGLHWNINGTYNFSHISQTDVNQNIIIANLSLGIGRLEHISEVFQAERICKGMNELGLNVNLYNEEDIFELAQQIRAYRYDFIRDNRRFAIYQNEQFFNYINSQGISNYDNSQLAGLIDLFNNEGNNLNYGEYNYSFSAFSSLFPLFNHRFQENLSLSQGKLLRIGITNTLNTSLEDQSNLAAFASAYGGKALSRKWHISGAAEFYNYFTSLRQRIVQARASLLHLVNSRALVHLNISTYNTSNERVIYQFHTASLGMNYTINYNSTFNLSYNLIYRSSNLDSFINNRLDHSIRINFAHYII